MHQDRNRVVIPNMDHIVKNINDLLIMKLIVGSKLYL